MATSSSTRPRSAGRTSVYSNASGPRTGTPGQHAPRRLLTGHNTDDAPPSNAELERKLTSLLKRSGATATIEVLTSWLYQRAIVRYRQGDYLSASRDCDRVAEKCAGCVHGRILFLNAKAHRRLKNWRAFGLNLYRACVEAIGMDYYCIFASVAGLCCVTPVFDETEDLFTGVLLLLQKCSRGLLALLNSKFGVEFFWHLLNLGDPPSSTPIRKNLSREFSRASDADRGGATASDAPHSTAATASAAPPKAVSDDDLLIISNLDEGINVSELFHDATEQGHQTALDISPDSKSKQTNYRAKRPGGTKGSQFLESLALKTLVFGLTELRHERDWMRKFEKNPELFRSLAKFCTPDVNLHLSFTTITLYTELIATGTQSDCSDAKILAAQMTRGNRASPFGLSSQPSPGDRDAENNFRRERAAEVGGDFSSTYGGNRSGGPRRREVGVETAAISVRGEVSGNLAHVVDVDDILPAIFECFLSEKDELVHATARFLVEVQRADPEKLRLQVLDYFVKFLDQRATTLRAFILATLLPVVANATFASVSDPLSLIDELGNDEKRKLLKYLKIAVANCVDSPALWVTVRKNVVGFLLLFLDRTSEPFDDATLLARNLDKDKLATFLLQKSTLQECLKSVQGATVLRRIAALGWMYDEFADRRLVDKLVDALEQIHGKLYEGRRRTSEVDGGAGASAGGQAVGASGAALSPRPRSMSRSEVGRNYELTPTEWQVGHDQKGSTPCSRPRSRSSSRSPAKSVALQQSGRGSTGRGGRGEMNRMHNDDEQLGDQARQRQRERLNVDRLESLGSALLRCLGLLLLKQPNFRFGLPQEEALQGETDKEVIAREEKEQQTQNELQQQFLAKVGTFPTLRDQWVLSLAPAVRTCSRGNLTNISAVDLQRICRGHRLTSMFAEFASVSADKAGNLVGVVSPMNKVRKDFGTMKFETTMGVVAGAAPEGAGAGPSSAGVGFDGVAIEKNLRLGGNAEVGAGGPLGTLGEDDRELPYVEKRDDLREPYDFQTELAWLSEQAGAVPDDPRWFLNGMPPPGWLRRLKRILDAREMEIAADQDVMIVPVEQNATRSTTAHLLPQEKADDQWTVSGKFRADLQKWFLQIQSSTSTTGTDERYNTTTSLIIELGTYLGYTTRLLSDHFGKVFALDGDPFFLRLNKLYNSDRSNIEFFQVESPNIDWKWLYERAAGGRGGNDSSSAAASATASASKSITVFLDASHDFISVCNELRGLFLSRVPVEFFIFDDFAAEPQGVQIAVLFFIRRGFLRRVKYVGEQRGFSLRDGRTVFGPEGVVCRSRLLLQDEEQEGKLSYLNSDVFQQELQYVWSMIEARGEVMEKQRARIKEDSTRTGKLKVGGEKLEEPWEWRRFVEDLWADADGMDGQCTGSEAVADHADGHTCWRWVPFSGRKSPQEATTASAPAHSQKWKLFFVSFLKSSTGTSAGAGIMAISGRSERGKPKPPPWSFLCVVRPGHEGVNIFQKDKEESEATALILKY
eukprot:g16205.t1